MRYGLVWCPTDDLERCVVPDPEAALGDPDEARRYDELIDTVRDWNAQLPTRDSNAWLASKGGTASDRWPRSILWIAVAAVALAVRRPRGSAPILVLMGVGALVLGVHALSQAPQSEFALPFVPVWIVAALVGLLAPRGGQEPLPGTSPRPCRARRRGVLLAPRVADREVAGRRSYNHAVPRLELIPPGEFTRVASAGLDADERLALLADMCRANALVAVKRAGSGHLGSTFSSLDLVAHLLWEELNVAELGFDSPDRDVFFSSKGHDVPGLYAALNALGVVPTERLLRLRRLGGLDGHPDVGVPGIEANSGSLGMGISKARGIAWAKRHLGRGGRVVVMTGDGELQEGQNWEALQAAAHQRVGRLLVLVDRNELQSDKATEEILALESLEAKLVAFGCRVVSCDGHDHGVLRDAFRTLWRGDDGTPGVLIARTIKGKGVSFMEHPAALAAGGGTYRWHAGAPDDATFAAAAAELRDRIERHVRRPRPRPDSSFEVVPPLEDDRGTSLQGEPESGAGAPAPKAAVTRREAPSTSPPRTARRSSSSRAASRGSSSSTPTSPPTAACARSS